MELSHSSSLSFDDGTEAETVASEDHISQTFRIRLHAANLPVRGVFRGGPDTYAVVTSTADVHTPQNATTPTIKPVVLNCYDRTISSCSVNSTSSTSAVVLGQTEVVHNSRHPQWTQTATVKHTTGASTFFYVHLLEHDRESKRDLTNSFGTALFHVRDLLATKNHTRAKRLRQGGCLFCRLEPVLEATNDGRWVRLELRALNLHVSSKGVFKQRKPNTVLEIAKRSTDTGAWIVVHRTAPVEKSVDPVYDPIKIDLDSLCGSNLDQHLRLSIYPTKTKNHRRVLLGMCETTLRNLLRNPEHALDEEEDWTSPSEQDDDEQQPQLELFLQRNSHKLKEVGRLRVCRAKLFSDNGSWSVDDVPVLSEQHEESPRQSVVEVVNLANLVPLAPSSHLQAASRQKSFSSYVDQGYQIDFCVAIDFTSSNGDPNKEGSYHHLSKNTLNDYEETISAIGQSLAQYSKSNEYAVWGFGAKYGGVIRHIFQCGSTPTVSGVDGILQAYKTVFASDLTMSGPTNFNSVIQAAAVRAKRNHDEMSDHQRYTVLLVITDGIMDNLEDTRSRIDAYSSMPLSIVFVGVGRSDFRVMYHLCQPRTSRCCTTFVEFRRHQHDPAALGEEALRNIPSQLCAYMQSQGL